MMNKIRTYFYLLLVGFFIQNSQAQKSLVTSGGDVTGTSGTVSYSVGQTIYTNATGIGGGITQGVQQPFEIVTLGTDNFPEITLSISVYPNPTTSIINLKIDDFNIENLQFYLFDVTGKQLQSQKITNTETSIEMKNLPQAVYLLNVQNKNTIIKNFRIIKN